MRLRASGETVRGSFPLSCGSGRSGIIVGIWRDIVAGVRGTAQPIRTIAMNGIDEQQEWLDGESPASDRDAHATKRVLDELFYFARQFLSKRGLQVRGHWSEHGKQSTNRRPPVAFAAPAHPGRTRNGERDDTLVLYALRGVVGDPIGRPPHASFQVAGNLALDNSAEDPDAIKKAASAKVLAENVWI